MVQLSKENVKEMVGGKCGKGGAIMAECLKQADGLGKEGLLQDGERGDLIAKVLLLSEEEVRRVIYLAHQLLVPQ